MQPRMRQCQHLQGQIVPHQLQMTCLGNHVFLLENLPRFISAMFHICHGEQHPFSNPSADDLGISRQPVPPREEVAGEAQDVVRLVLQDLTRRRRGARKKCATFRGLTSMGSKWSGFNYSDMIQFGKNT